MLVAALRYSALYGFNVPYYDEWGFVDQITGESISLTWLWQAYGDHRLPLAKPIWLFWIRATNSFRVGALVNIAFLGMLTLAMMRAAKRLRGRASYADAFFPLLILHVGQGINFLWSYQISEMLPAFLECVILLIVVTHPSLNRKAALGLGICLVLLALAGPGGLAFALAGVAALAVWGIGHSEKQPKPMDAALAFGFAGLTLLLVGLYFYGFKGQENPKTLVAVTRGAVEFLSVSFGPATRGNEAFPAWKYAGVGMIILVLLTMTLVAWSWLHKLPKHWRAVALFLILGSGLGLAVGMGLARGPYGPGGALSHWYAIFAFPMVAGVYFAWVLYGPPTLGALVQMCLFTITAALLPLNVEAGRLEARQRGEVVCAFERDLSSDLTPIVVADRHAYSITNADIYRAIPAQFEDDLRRLHAARIGPFQNMRGPFIDPKRIISVPLEPLRTNDLKWENGVAYGTGDDPYLVLQLEKPMFVSAVRLMFTYEAATADANCEFYWCLTSQNGFTESERYRKWTQPTVPKPGEDPNYYYDIVVNDWIDRIRIDPDNKPCKFRLKEVLLMVPATPIQ